MMGPETMRVLGELGLTLAQAALVEQALRADMSADIRADMSAELQRAKWRKQKADQRERDGQSADMSTGHPPKTLRPKPSASENSPPPGRKSPPYPPARTCPADWTPSPGVLAVGEAEGLTPGEIERELAKMRDHQFHDAKRDWDGVARNWLRTASDRKPNGSAAHDPGYGPRALARQANLRRAFEAPSLFAGPPARDPHGG